MVKNLPTVQETWEIEVLSLGQEDLEEEMANSFSILAWRIPWTEKTGGYKETDTTEATKLQTLLA